MLFILCLLLTRLVFTSSAPFTLSHVQNFQGHGPRLNDVPSPPTYPVLLPSIKTSNCPSSPNQPKTTSQHEHYFPQATVNNFAATPSCHYNQRFFLNTTFCTQDNCPVFLYVGGEGPLTIGTVGPRLFMHQLAAIHGAVVVSLEHRYYGKSWPTVDMSTENLKHYLSSAQALADLANFQQWFGTSGASTKYFPTYKLSKSEWVAFGGSYPGNLAAWVKIKYPQSFVGTVASSAPVKAVENWPGYMEVVSDSLKHFGNIECFNVVSTSAKMVMDFVKKEDWKTLNTLWNTCQPGLSSASKTNGDLGTFLSNMQGFFQGLVQYNRDRPSSPTVAKTCKLLLENPDDTFQVFINLTKNTAAKDSCTEYSTSDVYVALNNITLTGDASSAMRPWTFQTCNEFGYFQVVGTDPKLDAFSSMSDYINLKSFTDICDDIFEMNGAKPRTQWSNTQYGLPSSMAAVNVTFPSGSLDPWHVLGVTNASHPWTPLDLISKLESDNSDSFLSSTMFANELAVEIPFTSHCQDMYANDFNIPEIKWAHNIIRSRVAHYLSSYTKTIPAVAPTPASPSKTPSGNVPSGSSPSGSDNTGNNSPITLPIILSLLCGIFAGAAGVVLFSYVSKRQKYGARLPSRSISQLNNYDTDYQVMGGGDTYEDI